MLFLIPITFFPFIGIIGLLLWVKMINILQDKDVQVNYNLISPGQLLQFREVIQKEEDLKMKWEYRLLLAGQIAVVLIYLIGMYVVLRVFH